jgi:methylenetetrahydrofolate--tRNA-(uracil-5-)-methyltransferase
MTETITIIGGGLAGCEAAWQAAERGVRVHLLEMKPRQMSPAHCLPGLAELVCSNSLRGESFENAVGLLKEEMRRCGSLFIAAAEATRVPAGGALAVDRERFSAWITEHIEAHPRIEVFHGEAHDIPEEGVVVVASGPLTSDALAAAIGRRTGAYLYFYDAIAPIVTSASIDMNKSYRASRYGKGEGDDYLNCPLSEDEYRAFVEALRQGEKVQPRSFEKVVHFEGCMPVEVLAERGEETLRYGPMKPVGLTDPRTGQEPYAVVQLRLENREGTLYNLVGFQTKLTWPEQRRIFSMIPALERAEFARLGSMHRNTFINAPALLLPTFQFRGEERLLFAGQITGVEGYVESAASGLLAGINAARIARGEVPLVPPRDTAMGALSGHITEADPAHFQPMNINYGLFPPLPGRVKKKERRGIMAQRALDSLEQWIATISG